MARNSKKTVAEETSGELTVQTFLKYYQEIDEQDEAIKSAMHSANIYSHHVEDSWEYISFHNVRELVRLLNMLKKNYITKKPVICDVGAGTGRMVRIFRDFGFKAFGVEFHPPYVENGRKVFDLSEQELILADAFKVPDEVYQSADVLYTYMPIRNCQKMAELHLHLYHVAKPGAILVEMYPVYYPTTMLRSKTSEFPGDEFVVVNRRWHRGD